MVRGLAPVVLFAFAVGCSSDGDDKSAACGAGRVVCGDACVDLRTDESACGACGVACGAGEICSAGACRRACSTQRFVLEEAVVIPGGDHPLAATAADVNGDGLAELVIADSVSKARVLPQLSRREFGVAVELADTNGPVALAVADLDEDGVPDLIVGERWEDRVLSLRGTGDGGFAKRWMDRIAAYVWGLSTGELDGDGHVDIVATAPNEGQVILFRGSGDGTFAAFERFRFAGRPEQPAVGDFDGDGRDDVAFVDGGTDHVYVLRNRDGGYAPEEVDGLERITGLAAGDYDGDGLDDLSVATSRGVSLLLGRPTGPFERLPVLAGSVLNASLVAGDVDGDGLAEVVAVGSGVLQVLGFAGSASSVVAEAEAVLGNAPVLVDLDGDRVLDLLTVRGQPTSQVIAVYGDCR